MRKIFRLLFLIYVFFLFVAWQVTGTSATFTITSTHNGLIQADDEMYIDPQKEKHDASKSGENDKLSEKDSSLSDELNDDETDEKNGENEQEESSSEKEANESSSEHGESASVRMNETRLKQAYEKILILA